MASARQKPIRAACLFSLMVLLALNLSVEAESVSSGRRGSRRGSRFMQTRGSFVLSANRAGNDELESESDLDTAEELGESVEEIEVEEVHKQSIRANSLLFCIQPAQSISCDGCTFGSAAYTAAIKAIQPK